jgi:hypothetical protein
MCSNLIALLAARPMWLVGAPLPQHRAVPRVQQHQEHVCVVHIERGRGMQLLWLQPVGRAAGWGAFRGSPSAGAALLGLVINVGRVCAAGRWGRSPLAARRLGGDWPDTQNTAFLSGGPLSCWAAESNTGSAGTNTGPGWPRWRGGRPLVPSGANQGGARWRGRHPRGPAPLALLAGRQQGTRSPGWVGGAQARAGVVAVRTGRGVREACLWVMGSAAAVVTMRAGGCRPWAAGHL